MARLRLNDEPLTDANPWAIEFRNGLYFKDLESDNSVPIERARRFASMRDVDDFVTRHEWILFNGGMPVEVCLKCLKQVDYRGQVHCKPTAFVEAPKRASRGRR